MVSVQPFDFSRLPHISREEISYLNRLQCFLPPTVLVEKIQSSLEQALGKEAGVEFSLRPERVATAKTSGYLQTLPNPGLYLLVGLPPFEEKAFCEIDMTLAHFLIDRLLGGSGATPVPLRPLTEIEEGVFSYLALKVLSVLYDACGRSERVHFRVQELLSAPEELSRFISQASLVVLTYSVRAGNRSGYLRLVFPAPFVQKVFSEAMPRTKEERAFYEGRLSAFGFIRTDLWGEVGRVTLSSSELSGVKGGDVILLDSSDVRLREGKPSGNLTLRVGSGEISSLQGRIDKMDRGHVEVRL